MAAAASKAATPAGSGRCVPAFGQKRKCDLALQTKAWSHGVWNKDVMIALVAQSGQYPNRLPWFEHLFFRLDLEREFRHLRQLRARL